MRCAVHANCTGKCGVSNKLVVACTVGITHFSMQQLLFLHSCQHQDCMQSHLGTINLFFLCWSNQLACPVAADTVNRTAALTTSGVAFYVIPLLLLFDSNWIRSSIGTYLLGRWHWVIQATVLLPSWEGSRRPQAGFAVAVHVRIRVGSFHQLDVCFVQHGLMTVVLQNDVIHLPSRTGLLMLYHWRNCTQNR